MTYPFIQAKHYTPGRDGKPIKLIVVHTMETPQTEGRAKQVALWFAGDNAPQASAHYMVDDKEVIQSVNEADTAWAVNQQDINQQSISIEHAGYAAQTPQVGRYICHGSNSPQRGFNGRFSPSPRHSSGQVNPCTDPCWPVWPMWPC